jgi:hypothetical protein
MTSGVTQFARNDFDGHPAVRVRRRSPRAPAKRKGMAFAPASVRLIEGLMQSKVLRFTEGWRLAFRTREPRPPRWYRARRRRRWPDNEHKGADHALVVDGNGTARQRAQTTLKKGMLLLIDRRDRHEIRNTSKKLLRTLNLYVRRRSRLAAHPCPPARASSTRTISQTRSR